MPITGVDDTHLAINVFYIDWFLFLLPSLSLSPFFFPIPYYIELFSTLSLSFFPFFFQDPITVSSFLLKIFPYTVVEILIGDVSIFTAKF